MPDTHTHEYYSKTVTSWRKLKSRSGFRLTDDLCELTAALLNLMFVLSITGVTLGLFCDNNNNFWFFFKDKCRVISSYFYCSSLTT